MQIVYHSPSKYCCCLKKYLLRNETQGAAQQMTRHFSFNRRDNECARDEVIRPEDEFFEVTNAAFLLSTAVTVQ